MANKLYRVSRTENEDTGVASTATITRADEPQILPVVTVDENGNPDIENPVENGIYATAEDKQEVLFVTDKITEGDLNPVTSNAVKKAIDDIKNVYSTEEQIVGQWIDGKPIYQRVYLGNETIGTGYVTIDASLKPSLIHIISIDGIINDHQLPIGYGTYATPTISEAEGLYWESASTYSKKNYIIIVKYYKLTD